MKMTSAGIMTRVFGCAAAAAMAGGLVSTTLPVASAAEPCNNVEVVFARGTNELPGVGATGQAFVDALRGEVGGQSVGVYAVNYPATRDFPAAAVGVDDAKAYIEGLASRCPRSDVVLSGYSQGAAVAELVTADVPPPGFDAGNRVPLSERASSKIKAVALFGAPNQRALEFLNLPVFGVNAPYQARTISLCNLNDPVCSDGLDPGAHQGYATNGLAVQAAQFAAEKV